MRMTESRLRRIIRSVILENENSLMNVSEWWKDLQMTHRYDPNEDEWYDRMRKLTDIFHTCHAHDIKIISFAELEGLGYLDKDIIDACGEGDNPYWVNIDEEQRVVKLGDTDNI